MTKEICGDGVMETQKTIQFSNGGSIPTSPLQLVFENIKPKFACELNAVWHSRFPYIHYTNVTRTGKYAFYGARYLDMYFAVAIWSRPIAGNRLKDGWSMLELRRMAISSDAPKNTASRMLSWMRKDLKRKFPDIKKLISYQDTEAHLGTIYKASGWTLVNTLSKQTNWTDTGRKRNAPQSSAPKVRWEILV